MITFIISTSLFWPKVQASQKPLVITYSISPSEVDLQAVNTDVEIVSVVSHPFGIENSTIVATLTNSKFDSISVTLKREDNPIVPGLDKVIFRGNLSVPRSLPTSVYDISFSSVKNNSSAGYQYPSSDSNKIKIRDLYGAEYGLLVRSGGELNLEIDTFVGPTFNTSLDLIYEDSTMFNNDNPPIWKVGEIFDPKKFYEVKAKKLPLSINSKTPTICNSDGKLLKLVAEGFCTFVVSTPKTSDYLSKVDEQSVTVTSARLKPTLNVENIPNQTSVGLPKSIEIFRVYSPSVGYVLPKSETPSVCVPIGFSIQIINGGTCTLTFQAMETSDYLASNVYKMTFVVVRDAQTISFTPPATANLSAKTLALSATVSSGGMITYQTTSTGICSITGSTLNLLKGGNCAITATQAGSATLAPISATATVMIAGSVAPTKKTITCVKGNKTKKVSGTNPKCPKGYKIKR